MWASLIAQLVKNRLQCRRPQFNSWVRKIHWRSVRLPTPVFLGSASKESACNVGDLSSNPELGRSPGVGKGYPMPVFWPREFHGLYSPWGHKELDTTEWLSFSHSHEKAWKERGQKSKKVWSGTLSVHSGTSQKWPPVLTLSMGSIGYRGINTRDSGPKSAFFTKRNK